MERQLLIANIAAESPAVLAPMAGYTDSAFRRLCRRRHCGLVYTELVAVEGIRRRHARTLLYLDSLPEERPLAAHLYGGDPAAFGAAARVVEQLGRFDAIDINAGCPVRQIMNRGDGAGLLRDLPRLEAIVRAVRENCALPVTVKTRIGLRPAQTNILEVLECVQRGGAHALAIHGRFACNAHKGPADWETIAAVKRQSAIPILGNGGIATAAQALELWRKTGVDGVMIGRGAIGNPWIFDEFHSLWQGRVWQPPTPAERRAMIVEHLEGLVGQFTREEPLRRWHHIPPEVGACRAFRGILLRYLRGVEGLRDRLLSDLPAIESVAGLMARVDEILAG